MWSLCLKALTAASVALLLTGTTVGAQGLPGGLITPEADDPVQQLMLAGEASAVAQFLDISVEQLRAELTGHSLAEVAQQHGKSVEEATSVVVDAANRQLDTAVRIGELSSFTAARYRFMIAFFAPTLVNSEEASALALQFASGHQDGAGGA